MSSIALRSLSYATSDGHVLFRDLDLAFGAGRTGLVGRNGIGKSTLIRLIAGELTPSSGTIAREGVLRVLRQDIGASPSETVADGFGVAHALARLRRVLAGAGSVEDVAAADWTLEERLAEALAGIGLSHVTADRPLTTLSGGQRTRLALAALVFDQPDMILLDEPTNNLDREGRDLVARLLERWRGGAVVVSHDRELLRGMDRIVELSDLGARSYGGNWDFYAGRKREERAAAEQALGAAEHQVAAVKRKLQVERERKAKRNAAGRKERATGSQGKMLLDAMQQRAENSMKRSSRTAERQLEEAAARVEEARANVERARTIKPRLPATDLPAGKTVLQVDAITGGYKAGNPVIRDLSFTIVGPERVAIVGPNGAGKTTLLRLVMGELHPASGSVRRSGAAAMLDQQVALLDQRETIAANFRRLNPQDGENACRAALARFLFRADAALRRVRSLSGGEMLRAGLACVIGGSRPPRLLILDEPTNHLDLDSIAAIEAGLADYGGALLVVSHDRDFLAAIGTTRTIEL